MNVSMLWIDDQIDRYTPWIQKFSEAGLTVSTETTIAGGIRRLETDKFDIVFTDVMMVHESSLPVFSQIAAKAQNARLFICSGFFYMEHVLQQSKEKIVNSDVPIGRIDKTNLPFPDDDDAVKDFLNDLMSDEFLHSSADFPDANQLAQDIVSRSNFISWQDYQDLDINGRMAALDKVAELTKEVRDALFAEGYVYFVFCGSYNHPAIKNKTLEYIPDDHHLLDLARAHNAAPFAFSVGGIIDDISSRCCSRSGLSSYPTVKMAFKDSSVQVHFDTGNSLNLLSYDWYAEKGWLSRLFFVEYYTAGEMEFKGRHIKIENVLFADTTGQTQTSLLRGFAVCNWEDYRIAAHCGPSCTNQNHKQTGNLLCKFRTALLGRNLPRDMNKRFLIDFESGEVVFVERFQ